MSAIGDLTLSEVVQRLVRYRPVAVTVVVVLVALRVLPQHDAAEAEPRAAAPAAVLTDVGAAPVPTTSASSPVAGAPPASPTTSVVVVSAPPVDHHDVSPAPALPPTTIASPPATTVAPPTSTPPRPQLVATAWASASAGTPLADTGVPAGSLPVGTRLGDRDKVSFLRFDVAPTTVELTVDHDGDRGIDAPVVQACRITTATWDSGEALDFDEAPQWDPDACVDGRGDGDTWVFDVAALAAAHGVALVPAPDAPVDFQVAFRPPRS